MCVVYKITNSVNNKIYIGCTIKTLKQRFSMHFRQRKAHKNTLLSRAIIKHGIQNFIIELIRGVYERRSNV